MEISVLFIFIEIASMRIPNWQGSRP